MQPEQRVPKISWITGVVHAGDAISETVLAELEALRLLTRQQRRNIDARVYCSSANVADTAIQLAPQWQTPLSDPHFQTSDIYVFHFGVYNDLHHLMNFVRRDAKVVIWFHNITPSQHLPRSAEDLIHKSFQQVENFVVADHVLVNSKHTADTLTGTGLKLPVQVIPLFGRNAEDPEAVDRDSGPLTAQRPVEILSCGRFVRSKSLHTLLEALAILGSRPGPREFNLTLAGLRKYSDPDYILRLQHMASGLGPHASCRFAFDASRAAMQGLFRQTDLFVLPSLHEGFGMPVVEAISAGIPVISTRAGALEEVCDGLALHFETGNAAALAEAIDKQVASRLEGRVLCERGDVAMTQWRDWARDMARVYSREAYVDRFAALLDSWLSGMRRLSKSRAEALQLIHRDSGLLAQVVPPADGCDARIAAGLLHHEVRQSMDGDVNRALISLLKWPFPTAVQSESDLAYWRKELQAAGLPALVGQLAGSDNVRSLPFAQQTGASLLEYMLRADALSEVPPLQSDGDADALPVRVQLLTRAALPDSDFVRECYRLILGREPEEGGLGAFFRALQHGALTRVEIATEMWTSQESKLRRAIVQE